MASSAATASEDRSNQQISPRSEITAMDDRNGQLTTIEQQELLAKIHSVTQDPRIRCHELMERITYTLLLWYRIMKDKRYRYFGKEHELWERIYHGLVFKVPQLAPFTSHLLPQKDTDEWGWSLIQKFTGEAQFVEFLGLSISAVDALIKSKQRNYTDDTAAIGEPSNQKPQAQVSSASALSPSSPKNERFPSKESTNNGQGPLQVPIGVEGATPEGKGKARLSNSHQTVVPTSTDKSIQEVRGQEVKQANDQNQDVNQENQNQYEKLKQQQSKQEERTKEIMEEERGMPVVQEEQKEAVMQKEHVEMLQKQEDKIQLKQAEEYERMFTDLGFEILERIVHRSSMMHSMQQFVMSVAQAIREAGKPASTITVQSSIIHDILRGFAKDESLEKQVQQVIIALADIKPDHDSLARLKRIWKILENDCDALETPPQGENGTWKQSRAAIMRHMQENMAEILRIFETQIWNNSEAVRRAIQPAALVLEPYSGGFSPYLVRQARAIGRYVFWDAQHKRATFNLDAWHDLQVVIPALAEKLGPLYIDKAKCDFPNYNVIIDGAQVHLGKFLPTDFEIIAKSAPGQWQLFEGEVWPMEAGSAETPSSFLNERLLCRFKNAEVTLQTDYLYKKKTGFPLWMDYGKLQAVVANICVDIVLAPNPQRTISVEHRECEIGSLAINFSETQHKILNFLLEPYFKKQLKHTIAEKTTVVLTNVFNQLVRMTNNIERA